MSFDEVESGLAREFCEPVRHDGKAVVEGWEEDIQKPPDPGPIGWGPECVACLGQKIMAHLHTRQMAEQDAVSVQGAFGISSGA